jgi:hypothetical protein
MGSIRRRIRFQTCAGQNTDPVSKITKAGYQQFTPVSLPTWEAEIRRVVVQSQPK